ncbi:MAG TPA: response regulator, partial [Polyangium sp.]|nr:response regulator [Polyangium sp.]
MPFVRDIRHNPSLFSGFSRRVVCGMGVAGGKTMKLLLVDDQNVVRESLAKVLRDEPDVTLVVEAESAKDALAQKNKQTFDVVVIELSLADRCGIELIRQIK